MKGHKIPPYSVFPRSDVFMTVMADTIPSKQIKSKTKVPYLTDDLLHLVRKKCRLFNWAKRIKSAIFDLIVCTHFYRNKIAEDACH